MDTNSANLEGIYMDIIVEVFVKILISKSWALGMLKLFISWDRKTEFV